ncbi:MAG: hypothetical protein HOE90_15170 [Bacteriovoracaceae bacterium]|jgi:hypothetical protein|nr:hypothetical protein [Bacteriovoracaceae bacterium]
MKTNISLAIVFTLLFSLAYLFEEKNIWGTRSVKLIDRMKTLKKEDITKLTMGKTEINFSKNKAFVGVESFPADQNSINRLFSIFSGLKIYRSLKVIGSGGEYFTQISPTLEVVTNKGHFSIKLGQRVPTSEKFYIEIAEKSTGLIEWLVAADSSSYPELYQEGKKDLALKWKRFKFLMTRDESFFYDRKILANFAGLERMKIEVSGAREFEVDFIRERTSIKPLKGIGFSKSKMKSYIEDVLAITADGVFPKGDGAPDSDLGTKLVHVKFFYGELVKEFELFQNAKLGDIYYLKDLIGGDLYIFTGRKISPLLVNVQDFWDKRPIIDDGSGKNGVKLDLFFSDGQNVDLKIPKGKTVDFVPSNLEHVVRKEKLVSLLKLLYGQTGKGQAFRVSPQSKSALDRIMKDNETLKVGIEGQRFLIRDKNAETIITNLKNGTNYHYIRSRDKKLGTKYSDFFITN